MTSIIDIVDMLPFIACMAIVAFELSCVGDDEN